MKKTVKILYAVTVVAIFVMSQVCCFAEEESATDLIEKAKIYIREGNKEKAVTTLDAAFEVANSSGDSSTLMQIGDLYIAVDTSLNEKAMKAWTAAGQWKCR
jgi:hypothetical protein